MHEQALKEVSKPYACQVIEANLDDFETIKPLTLQNVNVALSLRLIQAQYLELSKDLQPLFHDQAIHVISPSTLFQKEDCSYIDLTVNNIPTRAIVDTGAPFCIISSAFAKRLNKSPDNIHSKQYGTAGPHATTSL